MAESRNLNFFFTQRRTVRGASKLARPTDTARLRQGAGKKISRFRPQQLRTQLEYGARLARGNSARKGAPRVHTACRINPPAPPAAPHPHPSRSF